MEVRRNFRLLEYEHVIYYFEARDLEIPNIYTLFGEIFKFREDKSNNVFREILKFSRKTAKFEFIIVISCCLLIKKERLILLAVFSLFNVFPSFPYEFGAAIVSFYLWQISVLSQKWWRNPSSNSENQTQKILQKSTAKFQCFHKFCCWNFCLCQFQSTWFSSDTPHLGIRSFHQLSTIRRC